MTKRKDPKDYLKRGKPLKVFTPEEKKIIEEVFKAISLCQSLTSLAEKHKVPLTTLFDWMMKPEYAEEYAKAKEKRGYSAIEAILVAIEELKQGKYDPITTRLLIDTLKWLACKYYPKMFGDKSEVEHKGSVKIEIVRPAESATDESD